MAKKKRATTTGKTRGRRQAPKRKTGAAARAKTRTVRTRASASRKKPARPARKAAAPARKRPARAKSASPAGKRRAAAARKRPAAKSSSAKRRVVSAKAPAQKPAQARRNAAPSKSKASPPKSKTSAKRALRRGGSGREETLSQTPETGRSVRGRTNPMATRRSTGTPAGAGSSRHAPGLERERRQLRELEETVQGPPSSLDMGRGASAARSGRRHLQDSIDEHTETSPAMTGGDVDADWEEAYAVGDEAPGGDNPTPDQDRVDDIGKALGVEYQDNEELKGADKIAERDRHRWELDPASSDDYKDRD